MTDFTRYAVYYAPGSGPLAEFAASWLGWDAMAGCPRAHPTLPGLPRPVSELTATPRKYGFHGTLKPPFRLAPGSSRTALESDLARLARRLAPISMKGLQLSRIGGFLALTPEGDPAPLAGIAAAAVTALDSHRAHPSEDELARRRGAGLSPVQEENLAHWGYPYVLSEFRFHLTLTGKLTEAEAEATRAALAPVLAPLLPRPFAVSDLCLFGEDPAGMFHLVHRVALSG